MWQQLPAYYWAVACCSVSSAHDWPPKNICRFNGKDRSVPLFLRGDVKHNSGIKQSLKIYVSLSLMTKLKSLITIEF